MKSAVWMTLRESKSSFAVEGEGDRTDRIQRFAGVLGRRTGQGDVPLTEAALAELQAEILGERTSLHRFGLRQSPVFIGASVRFQEVVHYIAAPPEDLPPMLSGLRTFPDRTPGLPSASRTALVFAGFCCGIAAAYAVCSLHQLGNALMRPARRLTVGRIFASFSAHCFISVGESSCSL